MKIPALIILFFIYAFAGCPLLSSQVTIDAAELEQLKSVVRSQQNLLDPQQAEIQALQLALAEQKQMLVGIVQQRTQGGKRVPAVTEQNVDYHFAPPCGLRLRKTRQLPSTRSLL